MGRQRIRETKQRETKEINKTEEKERKEVRDRNRRGYLRLSFGLIPLIARNFNGGI